MTTYTVSFSDPTGRFTAQAASIQANVLYAANAISRWVPGVGDINISVTIDAAVNTANGTSATTVEVTTVSGVRILSQGYASEVATGTDPNGTAADVLIRVGADFLANTYWIDPTPETSNDIPARGYDFILGMKHELLHGLAFNGRRDWSTGALPGNDMSTYDQNVQMIGGAPYFTGATARAMYGANVPLWPVLLYHYGSPSDGRTGLLDGLMSGSGRESGRRYDLNDLDLAILQDSGVRISKPTTGTAGADMLSSPLQGTFSGLGGNDTIAGSLFADTLDGGSGVDTAVYGGTRASYTIAKTSTGHIVSGGTEGTDTLSNIERLQFADKKLALDLGLGESASNTIRIIGAAFGAFNIQQRPDWVGAGLNLFDSGVGILAVSNLVVPMLGLSNTAFVNAVYQNVVRAAPSAADLNHYVGLLAGSGGTMSQAQLLMLAANDNMTAATINLVGLQQSGVEFV